MTASSAGAADPAAHAVRRAATASSRRQRARPRALFVLGVPRSGTTLIGNYLGSAPGVLNLAEYGGFYVAHSVAPAVIDRMPGYYHAEYLAEIGAHARSFAERLARRDGYAWYLDHTPWNLEVAASLAADPPDALFVLMIRHYAGTILSLRRFPWAGDSWEANASLWVTLCQRIIELPADRLVAVGYDALALQPETTLATLRAGLDKHGFDSSGLDDRMLGISHAAIIGEPRPVIGVQHAGDDAEGESGLRPIPSLDAERWSGDIHARIWPIVRDTHFELLRRFPGIYQCPPEPSSLSVHDDVLGLTPYELEAW
ncbi:MAG: sulfotransferase family protein [Streptosporangiaceae bacterium]